MNILLTNDDGITSEGLQILADVLRQRHDVWIAAPDRERSAVSHCITLREPVKFHRIADRTYACSGTPADCVLYACHGAVPASPQVVISGINLGENIGTDIIYSGTVAAARQAVYHGIPGIAVSADSGNPAFTEAARLVLDELDALLELWNSRVVINVNVPGGYLRERGIRTAVPCIKQGTNRVHPYYRNDDEVFYFLSEFREDQTSHDAVLTDADVLASGTASITPVDVQPSADAERFERFSRRYAPEG